MKYIHVEQRHRAREQLTQQDERAAGSAHVARCGRVAVDAVRDARKKSYSRERKLRAKGMESRDLSWTTTERATTQ
jgi:hypothetical protein